MKAASFGGGSGTGETRQKITAGGAITTVAGINVLHITERVFKADPIVLEDPSTFIVAGVPDRTIIFEFGKKTTAYYTVQSGDYVDDVQDAVVLLKNANKRVTLVPKSDGTGYWVNQ